MENKRKFKKIFNRYTVLVFIMIALFATIVWKLYSLQVSSGQYYSDTANTNSHKLIPVTAPRGYITDKNGVKLATDVQSYELTYTDTTESNKQLFKTLQKVFQILDENGESQADSFALKTNPYRFEFNTSDSSEIEKLQLRFLKDRGLDSSILKQYFKGKKESDLTSAETSKLNDMLLKLTPEEVYNQLVKNYGVISGLKSIGISYNDNDVRRYLIVKDAIKMNSFSGYKPVVIASNIKKDTALIFMQSLSELPGINVDNQPIRQYPYGKLGSSVLGYLSKINTDQQEKYEEKGYDVSSDLIGASGIEGAMEDRLRGSNGGKIVQVDKQGRITNELAEREASPGQNVQLTLDSTVQYAAEQALQTQMQSLQKTGMVQDQNVTNATRGAAVAIDVKTGAVIALVSLPGFNPNDFANSQGLSDSQIQQYFNPDYETMAKQKGFSQDKINMMFPIDTSISGNTTRRKDTYDYFPKQLYDYATMSLIPSGSTFKPITAVAGLESGAIDEGTTYDDQGFFDLGGGNLDQFKSDGANGVVNVVSAIAKSSNPFFMNVGGLLRSKFGDDELAKYAWSFGLGANPSDPKAASTGIEIAENFGQVYNTYSQKKLSAQEFVLNVEQDLSTGKGGNGTTIPQIDLYDRSSDSKTVASIKTNIKNAIQDSVKNGTFSKQNYMDMFKQLISADSQYTGKNITDSQISAAVEDVRYQAVQTGYGSLKLPYNIYNAAIGQGMDAFTPLQLADYVATLVNGGNRYKIHLVDKITDSTGKVIDQIQPEVLNKADMSEKTRQLVMEGMDNVTADGTAAQAFQNFPIATGGKTGTAQPFSPDIQAATGRSDYATYVGYAPANDPQIAVSVVIFDGGYGSYAANVARGIYEGYFKDQLQKMNYPFDIDVNPKPEN
ncbi:MAG: penicillin-binding transpeptidase domain-containing protein [Clostridium sp.]|nr:penicillin-binding transpeptidase domain-containing protein [Clostridium sp.]